MKPWIPALLALFVLPVPAIAAQAVSVAPFDSVELRGGGHVTLRHGNAQRVTIIKGSKQFTGFRSESGRKLVIDACNSRCPGRYDLEIEIVTPNIEGVAISGGGEIETAGAFAAQPMLSVAVSGGGDIDVRPISAASVHAAVSGGGDVRVHADKSLTAAVDGGGSITYWGNPSVTSAVNGGGSVDRGAGG